MSVLWNFLLDCRPVRSSVDTYCKRCIFLGFTARSIWCLSGANLKKKSPGTEYQFNLSNTLFYRWDVLTDFRNCLDFGFHLYMSVETNMKRLNVQNRGSSRQGYDESLWEVCCSIKDVKQRENALPADTSPIRDLQWKVQKFCSVRSDMSDRSRISWFKIAFCYKTFCIDDTDVHFF